MSDTYNIAHTMYHKQYSTLFTTFNIDYAVHHVQFSICHMPFTHFKCYIICAMFTHMYHAPHMIYLYILHALFITYNVI